jgi:hypothetical protein
MPVSSPFRLWHLLPVKFWWFPTWGCETWQEESRWGPPSYRWHPLYLAWGNWNHSPQVCGTHWQRVEPCYVCLLPFLNDKSCSSLVRKWLVSFTESRVWAKFSNTELKSLLLGTSAQPLVY